MNTRVLTSNIRYELDCETIEHVVKYLSQFPPKAKLDFSETGYNETIVSVYLEESEEEYQARLAADKAATLEKERKRYLELKAKFEGEGL